MRASVWHGRRGSVLLGPTEHRVARYLDHMTRSGRVRLRTVDLAARLGLERSEAYRVTRSLRVLGLFGIENDRSGQAGGRWYWRTAIEHDGAELDRTRHRDAWARVKGWMAARRREAFRRLEDLRRERLSGVSVAAATARPVPPQGGPSFRELVGWAPPPEWKAT